MMMMTKMTVAIALRTKMTTVMLFLVQVDNCRWWGRAVLWLPSW